MEESDSDAVNAVVVGILSSFCDADDDDIAAASVAAQQHMKTMKDAHEDLEGARRRGSYPGKSGDKQRDVVMGDYAINRDCIGIDGRPPTYDKTVFDRRFRLPRVAFDRLYRGLCGVLCFQQRPSATGCSQSCTLQKFVAALRVLAYGEEYDRVHEYVRLSETTVNDTLFRFARFVIHSFGRIFFRILTLSDLVRVTGMYEEAGFPGGIG